MRIQCAFYLTPDLYEQHRFAVENLKAWQAREKQRNDDIDISQKRRSIFHREIYLSGLYLYQISNALPKLVSEQYAPDNVDVSRLIKLLALFDNNIDKPDLLKAQDMSLADNQWHKMEELFNVKLAEQQDQMLAAQKIIFENILEQKAIKNDEITHAHHLAQEDEQAKAHATLSGQTNVRQASSEKIEEQLTEIKEQQALLLSTIEKISIESSLTLTEQA